MSQGDVHPLGPLIYRGPPQKGAGFRTSAILLLLVTSSLLAIAAYVTPDPKGYGTHTQLGQYRCGWPQEYSIPCPTCGMTTAFALIVRGRVFKAFAVQPFGAVLALFTCLGATHALHTLATSRIWRFNFYRVPPNRIAILFALLLVTAWLYKILVTSGRMG